MRLLLDTHVILWTIVEPGRMPGGGFDLIGDVSNVKFFSSASIWEIAIKAALGRADFDVDPRRVLDAARLDFDELPVLSETAIRAAQLPLHHRDPFDRILVAQAIDEGALLLTADLALASYEPHVLLLG